MFIVKTNLPDNFVLKENILDFITKELVNSGAIYYAKGNSVCEGINAETGREGNINTCTDRTCEEVCTRE